MVGAEGLQIRGMVSSNFFFQTIDTRADREQVLEHLDPHQLARIGTSVSTVVCQPLCGMPKLAVLVANGSFG